MPTDNGNQGPQKDQSPPKRKSDDRSGQGRDGKAKTQDRSRASERK
ncbi:MAG: hypothetical protein ABI661_02160 [Gammaproteobacteria bacterium]